MASVSQAPSLFVRNATGLVKGWLGFDAFTYSFMSVNLVTLGMFYSLAIFAYVPDGAPIGSIVLSAIAVTFLAVTYSGLIAAMPRAGGDYVWQSRVLDGIPGIVSGAVVGGIGAYLVANAVALGDTLAIVAGIVGLIVGGALGRPRRGLPAPARVRAGRLRARLQPRGPEPVRRRQRLPGDDRQCGSQ